MEKLYLDPQYQEHRKRVGETWDAKHEKGTWKRGEKMIPRVIGILDKYDKQLGQRVLDIGSGSGRNAQYLAKRGHSVTCADFSLTGLQKARSKFEKDGLEVDQVLMDQNFLHFKDGTFDSAISIQSFQYNVTDDQINRSFAEVARVLKSGGIFFLRIRSKEFRDGKHTCTSEKGAIDARGYDLEELKSLADSHGFDIIEDPVDSWDDDAQGSVTRKGQWNIVMQKREK